MFRLPRLAVSLSLVVLALAAPAWAADQLNVAQTLANTKSILASGGQADIVVIGDSLCFEGLGWASWLPRFTNLMQNHYGNAGRGYQEFNPRYGAHDITGAIIGSGPNMDLAGGKALNGIWLGLKDVGGTAAIDTYDAQVALHYGTTSVGSQFAIRDSAGNLLDVVDSYAPTTGAAAWTHTFATADHELNIQVLDPSVALLFGVNNTNDNPGVRVHRGANSGYGTSNYIGRDPSFDAQLDLLDTDLVIISLGQNDYYSQAAYQQAFPYLINRLLKTVDDVLILGTYDSGSSRLPMIWSVQEQTAANLGVGFINLGTTAGDKSFFRDNGYLNDDNVHHSPAGADYLAQLIFNAFLTDGASLVPEPTTLFWLALGLTLSLRRRSGRTRRETEPGFPR
ncbi:MAG: SGNH/GDSL hydrolase family protein [Phycisphaeraceae bacterium]|nr:SGNH/GDSL hydrolase family protein [Phycisphaeraceae bacterium]